MDWLQISTIIAGLILALGTGLFSYRYQQAKDKITKIRIFMETLDNALIDDKITEEEFAALYENFKKLVME